LVRVVASIELCRGVDIFSATECSLLRISGCVVLTVLEKVGIIEFQGLGRPCAMRIWPITFLTLFRQELYFPDVEVGNHSATCDVIIFDVTRLF